MREAGNMSIILIEAAMLGDLSCAGGIYDAFNRAYNNVWNGWVLGWVAEAFGNQSRAVDDICDSKVKTCLVEASHSCVGIGTVFKENKGNVISCSERYVDTCRSWYKRRIDLAVLGRINWGLTVFRSNYD
jgi:hypothetical protein